MRSERLLPLLLSALLVASALAAPTAGAVPEGHILLMEWNAEDVAVDAAGNAYVVGWAWGGSSIDAALRKVGPDASVLWTVTFGGLQSDYADAVAVGPDGHVYVAGTTWSDAFPHSSGSYTTPGGETDVFFAKYTSGGALVYSTSFGGASSEEVHDIGVAPDNAAIIAGSTWSCDFPTTSGAYDRTHGSPCDAYVADAFVTKLTPDTRGLVYSTFLGGPETDEAFGVAVSTGSGSVIVAGWTGSATFPTTSGAFQRTYKGNADGFVAKLSTTGSLSYSTFLGGSGTDRINGVARDATSRPYVAGYTDSADFPVTSGAFQTTFGGGMNCGYWQGRGETWVEEACTDAFAARLGSSFDRLEWSTFLGTQLWEEAAGIAVDGANFAYVTGLTNASHFPSVENMLGYVGAADVFMLALAPNGRSVAYSALTGSQYNDYPQAITAMADGRTLHVGFAGDGTFTHNMRTTSTAEESYLIRMGTPSNGIFFDVRGGNRDWVEVFLGGKDGGRVTKLEGRDADSSTWTPMSKQTWGWWAGPVHNDVEDPLQFRATLDDGRVVTSCYTTFGYHSCISDPLPSDFTATYTNVKGNEWWIQANVAADGGILSKVEVSLDHGDWKPLKLQRWGSWAASYHAPEGTIVQLRATATSGATDLSDCYRWVSATLVDCGSGGGTPPGEEPALVFDHRGGNEWWVEVRITGEDAANVDTVLAHSTGNGGHGTLTLRSWGNWAGSIHIPPGERVYFEALGSRIETVSCPFTHPAGVEQCPDGPTGGEPPANETFDATFSQVRGNEWWVETNVAATGGTLAKVEARVNGGSWIALTKQSWGSWAKSIHAPAGSFVEFRATSTTGATDTSGQYRWPPS